MFRSRTAGVQTKGTAVRSSKPGPVRQAFQVSAASVWQDTRHRSNRPADRIPEKAEKPFQDAPSAFDFSAVPLFSPDEPDGRPYKAPFAGYGILQPKLAAKEIDDPHEREADRVAEQVVASRSPAPPEPTAIVSPRSIGSAGAGEFGGGQSLDASVRTQMEPRFGYDFSGIRVHTGAQADRSARSFGALAYTTGRDVVFRAGSYSPHTKDGQRLLAHELTHVVQQHKGADANGPQLKAIATRFQDEPTLDEISDGKKALKQGDKGEAVIRVTTALSELGFYKNSVIDEKFDPVLTSAVSDYQTARGLKGKVPDGTVEQKTFGKLDQDFSAGFKVERNLIAKQKSATILGETQSLDPAERTASARAISTETAVNPATGLPPVFHEDVPGKGKYGDRIRDAVEKMILAQWDRHGKGKTAAHKAPGGLYDATTVDAIAAESRNAVKSVFGEYIKAGGAAAPDLKLGSTVQDAFKQKEDSLKAGGTGAEDIAVAQRVNKILNGDRTVKAIDGEHGAIQTRGQEKAIVDPIRADLMKKHRAKLIETHKGWPGFEDKGVVFVQLFKGATPDQQKAERWKFFQVFIHEFIHSLEHKDHIKFRQGISERKGGFTLREGTTDYFTKIVWNSITIDEPLRARIEGPVHDPAAPFTVPPLTVYDEALNAERLAGVVGVRNEAAAFFLGKVELIGKP